MWLDPNSGDLRVPQSLVPLFLSPSLALCSELSCSLSLYTHALHQVTTRCALAVLVVVPTVVVSFLFRHFVCSCILVLAVLVWSLLMLRAPQEKRDIPIWGTVTNRSTSKEIDIEERILGILVEDTRHRSINLKNHWWSDCSVMHLCFSPCRGCMFIDSNTVCHLEIFLAF